MSKWLGVRAREVQVSAPSDEGPTLPAKHGRMAHRRKSSEETEQASRRSSQQSQNGGDPAEDIASKLAADRAADPRAEAAGGTDTSEGDWEVLDAASLQADVEDAESPDEMEPPMSPGVDFSAACCTAVDEESDAGEEVLEGDEREGKWVDAGNTHSFLVRGPTYLVDKDKRPAGPAMCRLVGFDCFTEESQTTSRIDHIASRGTCRERVEALTSGDEAPFLFIMNIQVRGTPTVSLVAYWAVDRASLEAAGEGTAETAANEANGVGLTEEGASQDRVFSRIVARYANLPVSTFGGDDCCMMDEAPPPPYSDERNMRFKLIPRVIGGPWMVRKAVGSTPVLLGTKINHRYYRGERYIETDMDTGSSAAASSLCGRCRGLSRKIDVELGIVLQANSPEELPEALLGAVRLNGFGVEDSSLQTKLFPS